MLRVVSGKKRLLVRFQDGCENYLTSNQLTKNTLDKGYYHGVYVILHLNKEDGVYRKEENVDIEQDTDEEDMEDVKLEDER